MGAEDEDVSEAEEDTSQGESAKPRDEKGLSGGIGDKL